MPRVSVITPTYNRADVLHRALGSVQQQSYHDAEHIIVDDGSTDDTPAVVEASADATNTIPIRYERLDENQGANAARNRGIELADGEYIAFLDSDDEYLPGRLAQTVAALDAAADDVAGVVHTYLIVETDGTERPSQTPTGDITLDDLRSSYPIGGFSCMLIRKRAVDSVGRLDPSLPAAQDYDLSLRLLCEYPRIIGIDATLARCHRHGGISASINRKQAAQQALWEKHNDILSEALRTRQAYTIAHQYALAGRMDDAWRSFWRSFRGDPSPLTLYHVLLAAAGKRPFDAGMTLKRRIAGWVL